MAFRSAVRLRACVPKTLTPSGTSATTILCSAFLAFALTASCAAQATGLDLNGRIVDPLRSNPGRAVVLIFVREDCPVSGRYAPTIQSLSERYQSAVRFYLVFPDKSRSSTDILKYTLDFHFSLAALRDPAHTLVKQAQVAVTPEAALFNPKGELIYHGRIDNLYEAFGRARPAPTIHDLEDAIHGMLEGHLPVNKNVPAVGCYISDLN